MFYNSSNSFEYGECISHGACSVSPNITSMQEVMYILLRQIAYYLIKLKKYNVNKENIVHDIITELAFIDAVRDFSEAQILNSFSKQYINLVGARKEYLKLCKENNDSCDDLRNLLKFSPKTSLSQILKRGDKEYLQKYKKLPVNQKYMAEILAGVQKSVCVNLISLFELDGSCTAASDTVLESLNIFNSNRVSIDKIKSQIDMLAQCDVELLKLINQARNEKFGKPILTSVSYSTKPGKAIMVSGSNLNDLSELLNSVKDKDIDVYTNGNLLTAHAFPYFKTFKNLKGHYGKGVLNTILDFATFPGAILLTRNEAQNLEYLYRGRLFTTDEITPKGVVRVENNDFSAVLESAIQAKGFAKGRDKDSGMIGFDENELNAFIDKISQTKYSKLFIIGPSNFSINQIDYFNKFFEIMPDDSFAITFSFNPDNKNVLSINIGNDYALLYAIMQKIFDKIDINSDNLAFFLTRCDINSLSNIINLKNKGAKHIFLSDCPPLVINPAVLRAFSNLFKINQISEPEKDILLVK